MQTFLRLIARLIVARHECTYVRHCKENAPIYMYYVAPETPMMSSVIADCLDLAPPIFWTSLRLWTERCRKLPLAEPRGVYPYTLVAQMRHLRNWGEVFWVLGGEELKI